MENMLIECHDGATETLFSSVFFFLQAAEKHSIDNDSNLHGNERAVQ